MQCGIKVHIHSSQHMGDILKWLGDISAMESSPIDSLSRIVLCVQCHGTLCWWESSKEIAEGRHLTESVGTHWQKGRSFLKGKQLDKFLGYLDMLVQVSTFGNNMDLPYSSHTKSTINNQWHNDAVRWQSWWSKFARKRRESPTWWMRQKLCGVPKTKKTLVLESEPEPKPL